MYDRGVRRSIDRLEFRFSTVGFHCWVAEFRVAEFRGRSCHTWRSRSCTSFVKPITCVRTESGPLVPVTLDPPTIVRRSSQTGCSQRLLWASFVSLPLECEQTVDFWSLSPLIRTQLCVDDLRNRGVRSAHTLWGDFAATFPRHWPLRQLLWMC